MSFVCFISTNMHNKYDFNKKYFVQSKKIVYKQVNFSFWKNAINNTR